MMKIIQNNDQINKVASEFTNSLSLDKRLYKHDILGSIAHVTMLGECDIISLQESELIAHTLSDIFYDINQSKLAFEGKNIQEFVLEELVNRIGDLGYKLNLARSYNEQFMLDTRLYVRESIDDILLLIKNLVENMMNLCEDNFLTIMPTYNNMKKSSPTTLAHYLMAYVQMFMRDIDRLADTRIRVNMMPLGCENGVGSSYPIDRKKVAALLNFDDITPNALDSNNDFDYVVEYLNNISLIMTHLSRLNADIILYSSEEFNFINLPDEYYDINELFPPRKITDINQLIRAKASRCYGNITTLLSLLQGLPLMNAKDYMENLDLIFDSENTVKSCIKMMDELLPHLTYNNTEIMKNVNSGFIVGSDCVDYLVMKGCEYDRAVNITQAVIAFCKEKNKRLDTIKVDDFQAFSPLFDKDIISSMRVKNIVQSRKTEGSSNKTMVKAEIRNTRKKLEKLFA